MHPSRDHARMRHLLDATSSLFWVWPSSTLTEHGWIFHNGSGDHFDVEWDVEDAVALVFNHESPRSQYHLPETDRTPRTHLSGLPQRLNHLVDQALANGMSEHLVTAGAWTERGVWVPSDDWSGFWCHGLEMLRPLSKPLRDAVINDWLETASLLPAHAETLLAALESGTLCAADQAILLAHPDGEPSPERFEGFREACSDAGIHLAAGPLS